MEKNLKNFDAFGLTKEDASKTRDIVPSYNLGKMKNGSTAAFKIIDEQPRKVQFEDKHTGEKKEQFVVNAVDKLTGMEVALWLSSKSLRQEMYKVYQKMGSLKDVPIVIAVREYDHEKWGTVRGYSVQVDRSGDDFGLE